jgi:tetratricopeptide (TPR) repeat protein
MDEALSCAEKAVAANPKNFGARWLHARILYKLNKKQEALDEAKQAATLAKGTAFEYEYQHDYETMQAEP